jgi:hypothetical protein
MSECVNFWYENNSVQNNEQNIYTSSVLIISGYKIVIFRDLCEQRQI